MHRHILWSNSGYSKQKIIKNEFEKKNQKRIGNWKLYPVSVRLNLDVWKDS